MILLIKYGEFYFLNDFTNACFKGVKKCDKKTHRRNKIVYINNIKENYAS